MSRSRVDPGETCEAGGAYLERHHSRTNGWPFKAMLLSFLVGTSFGAAPFVGLATKLNSKLQDRGDVQDYAISGDNRWVVYLADQEKDEIPELFSRPISGSGSPIKMNGPLVSGGSVSTFWLSPNGARVVYVADQEIEGRFEIYSRPLDGILGPAKLNAPLRIGGDVEGFGISPDSKWVVYFADQNAASTYEIYSSPLGGFADPKRINPPLIPGRNVTLFDISPDSKRVVYVSDQELEGIGEIYSRNIDGSGTAVKLNGSIQDAGSVQDFNISQDGRWVVYLADQDRRGVVELYSRPIDGAATSTKLNITLGFGRTVKFFDISPDSRFVVYVADQDQEGVFEIYSRAIDGTGISKKLNTAPPLNGEIAEFEISSDSQRVVYQSDQEKDNVLELFIRAIDGTGPNTKLNGTLIAGGNVESFKISPDGQRVLYTADQEQKSLNQLYVRSIDGNGTATRLSNSHSNGVQTYSIYSDNLVIYTADDTTAGVDELYLRPVDALSPATKLNPPLVAGGDITSRDRSDNGRWLVYLADQDRDQVLEIYSVQIGQMAPGELKWQFVTDGTEASSPALGPDSTLYVGSGKSIIAINSITGTQLWTVTVGQYVLSSPAVGRNNTVYIGSDDDNLYALDGASGAIKWVARAGSDIWSSPAIGADGTVYVGSWDDRIYALEGSSGAKKWEFKTGALIVSSPALGVDGTVYVGSRDNKIYALDGASGRKKWEFATGFWVDSSPAVGMDGTVYVGSFDSRIYALDGVTGLKKWDYITTGRVLSSPAIGLDGTIFAGSDDYRFYALDGATGRKKWAFRTEYFVESTPAVAADGTVYFGSQDGKLYALDAATGTKKWEFLTGYVINSGPAIGPDGTVYAMSSDGLLYALTGTAPLAASAWPKFHSSLDNDGSREIVTGAPAISFQSIGDIGVEGKPFDLRIVAGGAPPLSYQWYLNGQPLPDATEPRLFYPSFSLGNAGTYRIRVSNAVGFKESTDIEVKLGHELAVQVIGPGHVDRDSSKLAYLPNSVVSLTAVANNGRRFQGWSGDIVSTENPLRVSMTDSLKLYATFEALPGDLKWQFTAGGGTVRSSAAIGPDGTVFIGASDNFVYALDGKSGEKKWEFETGDDVEAPPAVSEEGTVYVGSFDGRVYALNGTTGAKLWDFATGGEIAASPAIAADGTVYIGSDDGNVYALDGKTGAKRWASPIGRRIFSSASISVDGTVYIGSRDFSVYALDAETGTTNWVFQTGHQVLSSPAISSDGTIYIGSNDGSVYALDGSTGDEKWEFTTGASVTSSPALGADGTVYVGSQDGKIYALDGMSGTKKWAFQTGSFVHSSPALGSDGTVYVASYDGSLYALDGATGVKKWEYVTGSGEISSSPAIGPDGTVYVGSFYSVLYAVQGTGSLAQTPWPKFRGGSLNIGRAIGAPSSETVERPVISYATYLGGSGHEFSPDKDAGNDIAVDKAGNIYVVGASNSQGRYDSDVVVRKFDPTGSRLLYEKFLDSNGSDDAGFGIAVDDSGNAYVTGSFGDYLLQRGLGVLAAKLSPTGDILYQSSFGSDNSIGLSGDVGVRIAVDSAGNAYITGITFESIVQPFPTTANAYQRSHGKGLTDGFVVKLDPSGAMVYSTFLGGVGFDRAWGIAVDQAGNVYIVGDSQGGFPTTAGVLQQSFAGGGSDAFVAKLNSAGSGLIYSTYLGGNGTDEGLAISIDRSGNAFITGMTAQTPITTNDFPLVNAFQTNYGGAKANAFVAKLNNSGSALLYSSFMGGRSASLEDVGVAIKVDAVGNAFLTGRTETFPDIFTGTRFPITNAFQEKHAGGVSDAFVMKLTPQGALAYSSYLGGTGGDNGNGIALSEEGKVYIVGTTSSQDFPIEAAYQPSPGGGGSCILGNCLDAFVAIVTPAAADDTALKITLDRDIPFLSWPKTKADFALEWTANLTAPVLWAPETGKPTDTGVELQLSIPLSGHARFYRLRSK